MKGLSPEPKTPPWPLRAAAEAWIRDADVVAWTATIGACEKASGSEQEEEGRTSMECRLLSMTGPRKMKSFRPSSNGRGDE